MSNKQEKLNEVVTTDSEDEEVPVEVSFKNNNKQSAAEELYVLCKIIIFFLVHKTNTQK